MPEVQQDFALRAVECGVSVVRHFFGGGGKCGAIAEGRRKREEGITATVSAIENVRRRQQRLLDLRLQ